MYYPRPKRSEHGDTYNEKSTIYRIFSILTGTFRILLLYCGFYGILTIVVAVIYFVMIYHTLDSDHSRMGTGIINSRSGMRFFPLPPGLNYNTFTIWYNRTTPAHTEKYTQALLNIVNQEFKKSVEYVHCEHNVSYDDGKFVLNLADQKKYCKVYDQEYLNWGKVCTPFGDGRSIQNVTGPFQLGKSAFGFTAGTPCIMLRLNRINAWTPSKNWLTPEKRKEYEQVGVRIWPNWERQVNQFSEVHQRNPSQYIWISCDGLTEVDRDLIGDLEYFPKERPALPKLYFPFKSEQNYLAPFVFIQFLNPAHHVVLRIHCVAYDNNLNLQQHLLSAVGSVNFELLID